MADNPIDEGVILDLNERFRGEVAKMREQLESRRDLLLNQRAALNSELHRVSLMLRALPIEPDAKALEALQTAREEPSMAVPDLVLLFIGTERMTGPEIVDAVKNARPDVQTDTVHSAIHRLVNRQALTAEGPRGSMVYRRNSEFIDAAPKGGEASEK